MEELVVSGAQGETVPITLPLSGAYEIEANLLVLADTVVVLQGQDSAIDTPAIGTQRLYSRPMRAGLARVEFSGAGQGGEVIFRYRGLA